ncbi:23S rRNA (adenine(1618)-N(6))-methyltransferase RlmF [Methyloradius palustris]|uniref:Ribosomal RNA large subunit methyltransferase F n=1 Tax=Methyloradius palustris TaxID=2778876 RepID=A0A8D5JMU9_9PROT|nr:23S rRNA (adenine(1618)-N(6))-methyltransferase RlmF [Methyloradius palustris]BCM26230.1 ribosomal RNA large subunit methyltransferase F [Methyloradius palustris]
MINQAVSFKGLAKKTALHSRNKHNGLYDFGQLMLASPQFAKFVKTNAYGNASIDFADAAAVKALNAALLHCYYGITAWDIPADYLCPPIPGRADYLHYLADLLAAGNGDVIPTGQQVRVLDIGVGANCIYPLIGQHEYGWRFVGAEIDPVAFANAQRVVDSNALSESINLRLQRSPAFIFNGIIQRDERFEITMCNPPFHASSEEANAAARRKLQGLGKKTTQAAKRDAPPALNFGGQAAELYCLGGESAFVARMVMESKQFAAQCLWFTTLVSKATTLPGVYCELKKAGALQIRTIDMAQGQKKSRIVVWTFLNANQHAIWRTQHWQGMGRANQPL